MGWLLASFLPLYESYFLGSSFSDTFYPYPSARTTSRINLLRLNERTDRGPAISNVCHRRSLGLLNPYLSVFRVPMIPSVLPRSLRTVSRTASATCHAPWPLGWMPHSLTPSVVSARQGPRRIAAPVVDHQRRRGLRTKDGAVSCKRLYGHLRLVHAPTDQRPKDIPSTEATQEIRQAKLHLFPCLVAHECTRLGQTGMQNFAFGHDPSSDPLHNLRDEALGHLVHSHRAWLWHVACT